MRARALLITVLVIVALGAAGLWWSLHRIASWEHACRDRGGRVHPVGHSAVCVSPDGRIVEVRR